jgi:hypothetical protein
MADSVVFNNCIVKNTYNQAIYFRNTVNKEYFGSLRITNCTFVDVPSVLNVSAPLADTKSTIQIDHCTFDSIGVNSPSARIITPDNLSYLSMSNSIVSNSASQVATDTALVAYGSSKLTHNNLYLTPSIAMHGMSQVSNTTVYNPAYYDRANFNYAPTNASILGAGNDGKQLGDLRWLATDDLMVEPDMVYVSNTELKLIFSQAVDTVSAAVATNYTLSGTVGLTGNPEAVSVVSPNEVVLTVADFGSAVDFATIIAEVAEVVNVMGDSVQDAANTATYIIPIAISMKGQLLANEAGQTVKATCGSTGSTIYLVPEQAIILSVNDLITLADSGDARKAIVAEAGVIVGIDVTDIMPGMYYGYAVNANETEWSQRSVNAAEIRGLEVDMEIQLSKTNGPGETVVAQSTYEINAIVYLVADSIDVTTISDLSGAVDNNDGTSANVVDAFEDLEISIEGVNPGRYRAYATSGDSISEKCIVPIQIEMYVGISSLSNKNVKIFAYKNTAYVETEKFEQTEITVFNVKGAIEYFNKAQSSRTEIYLTEGVYIIKVKRENNIQTKRIVIE